ncbi:hypothetical protein R80B4_02061 [Fibrobacteres bacterium R8-0-B4]
MENHFGAIRPDERIRVNIGCAVSEGGAAAGRTYRLTVVVRAKGGSWESVSPSSGGVVPSLDFTVAAPAAPPVAATPVAPPVATAPVAPPVAAPVAPPVAATTQAAPPAATPAAAAPATADANAAEKVDENMWRKYVYKPQTVVKNIPQYSVEVKEYKVTVDGVNDFAEVSGKVEDLTVFYILPKNITADTKVLYTVHGAGMEDDTFVKSLRYLSETENIAVIAPLYDNTKVARAHPDRLFEDFVKRFNLKAQKYILFGFSAGGGFTSRFGQFSDSKYIDYVINHSPAYYTAFACTDESFCPDAKKVSKYESVLTRNLKSRKTYITIGSNETTRGRLPNAIKLFETAKAYSEAHNTDLAWKFLVMEGVGHSVGNTTLPYIMDIIKGVVDENYTGYVKEVDLSNDNTPTPESVKTSAGKVIVGPLLKTHWTQGEPFKVLPDGRSAGWIGCGTIAIAQIMKYHNHPKRGTGKSEPYLLSTSSKDKTKVEQPSVSFDVDYDWANMLNTYTAGATEQQRKAVSTLTFHIAVSMRRDYMSGGGGVGEGPRSVEGSFINFFGYDKSIQRISRGYCTDSAWTAIIKGQLNAGLPVYCHGVNKEGTGDHSFIIDGYDNKDKFHINWGWGGKSDGYYSLNDLHPAGSDIEFNSSNRITVNIQPNKGSVGSHEMVLDAFTVGNTSVSQYELFSVNSRVASLGFFPGGQVGTALTDKWGNIVYVVGVKAFDELTLTGGRTYNADCFLKDNEKAGQYVLRIVTRLNGGEWKIVSLSNRTKNVPAAIDFTVKPPEPGAPVGGYGLALANFTTDKTATSPFEPFTVTSMLKNFVPPDTVNSEYVGAALIDGGGNVAAVVGTAKFFALPPTWGWQTRTMKCAVPGTVKPGRYRLRTIIKLAGNEEWRIATLATGDTPTSIDFTVNPPVPAPVGGYNLELVNFEPSKTSVSRKEPFAVKSRLKNVSPTETFPGGYLGVAIVDERGNILEVLGTFRHTAKRAPGELYDLKTIDCAVPEYVSPGRYKIRTIVKSNDNEEWRIATLAASGVPAVIDLTVER